MSTRRIVVGQVNGTASVISDSDAEILSFGSHGGNLAAVWPIDGSSSAFRASVLTIPAADGGEWDEFVADRFNDRLDLARLGMHQTATSDACFVIAGPVLLQLHGGQEITLNTGDVVLNDGVRHRWINPGRFAAAVFAVLIDRDPAGADGAS